MAERSNKTTEETMNEELTTLAMRYAVKYLYEKGDGSAPACNAMDLLQAALGSSSNHVQVPLDEVITFAKHELGDTATRQRDTDLLIEIVKDFGPKTMAELCRALWSGTRYVREIIEACDELVVVKRHRVMLDWVIDLAEKSGAEK
jgi:hypothetical protein